ncbi:MAG: helix-hairpin-helix domain-containing protein [Phycisphaerales bacterium]
MATNAETAAALSLIAQLLEILGEDKFRVISHQKAARVVEALTTDLAPLARRGKEGRAALMALDGIGPRIADKIIEFETSGRIAELDALRAKVPPGLPDLMQIPGMGPKTVALVWKERGVTDLDGLKRILADGSFATLPRMGEKAAEKIKAGLAILAEGQSRLRIGIALPIAEAVVARMENVKGVKRAAFAGSLRRGKETIGDIDVLVVTASPAPVVEAFCTQPGVRQVIARGETRSSIRLAIDSDFGRWAGAGEKEEGAGAATTGPSIQVDLRVLPAGSWGAALMYFTGSKEHNIRLRERALKMGLTLNDYGLFPDDGEPAPQDRGIKSVAGATEEEVYRALELPFIPPELREDRGEVNLTRTPALVEIGDIRAELHSHTTASDGEMSIVESATEAKRRGFHTLAVTDHSKSSAIANGLSPERLRAHIKAVHAARKDPALKGLTLLAGSEVDILSDGSLDYDDELLGELDLVVASPHSSLSQKPEVATARLLRAIEHPRVRILGHPTGRLILRRSGLAPDMDALFAAAKKHNVALEVNAHWMRLDLRDTHVFAAVKAGCLIAINCDVHAGSDYDNLRFGVTTARRGWCPPEQCVNTWPQKKLAAWIDEKRA